MVRHSQSQIWEWNNEEEKAIYPIQVKRLN